MAFRLTKIEHTNRNEMIEVARDQLQVLNEAIVSFNAVLTTEHGNLANALANYNEVVADIINFAEDIATTRQTLFDEKSERWQNGDRGQEAANWISAWSELDAQEEELDIRDQLPQVDSDVIDAFETLPEEAE